MLVSFAGRLRMPTSSGISSRPSDLDCELWLSSWMTVSTFRQTHVSKSSTRFPRTRGPRRFHVKVQVTSSHPSKLFVESVTHACTQFSQPEGLVGRCQDGVRGECHERFWRRGSVLGCAIVSPVLLIDVERENILNCASIYFGNVEAILGC